MLSKFLDPKNDVAFKKIFGSEKNKDILIHFLNDVLGFTGNNQIHDVEFLSPIQDPEIASKKQSLVDVLCKDKLGVQYIVEMQVAPAKGFEKRAQYYAAKAYCRQADKGQGEAGKYNNLKEIIFIAIADCVLFPEKKEYKSDHVILDKNSYEHDLKDFYFTFIELPKFPKKKGDKLENLVEKWCYYFKYADETSGEDLERIIGSDLVIRRAYEALAQFNWTEPELLAYEQETKRVWDNQAVMEAALDAATEKATAQGMAKGMAKGMAEEKIAMAKEMLADNEPIDKIVKYTKLSREEIEKLNK